MSSDLDEMKFEAMLKAAVIQYSLNELERYPPQKDMDQLQISDTCDGKIRKMMTQFRHRQLFRKGWRILKRTAAVITVAAGISFIFLFQFKEVRAACYRIFIEITSQYNQYDFEAPGEDVGQIELGYIPDGLQKTDENRDAVSYYVRFEDDKKNGFSFLFSVSVSSNLDNEHHSITDVTINGSDGQYYASTDERFSNMLIWYNDKGCFVIDGTLDKDEIFKIAENIKY